MQKGSGCFPSLSCLAESLSAYPPIRLPAYPPSTNPPRRHSLRPVIPILDGADVGHSPVVPVPAVESVELEGPEPAVHVRHDDESVGIPHVHAITALRLGSDSIGRLVVEGVIETDLDRVGGIPHVQNVEPVLV